MNLPTRLIATGFFAGYSGFAPGTVGSAVALVIYCLLPPLSILSWFVFLSLLFLVAVWSSSKGVAAWGSDPQAVVIDEILGYFVTVCLLPPSVGIGVIGFFLFRALDIWKPQPARASEALPSGWGVVLDDVVAGIYGNLILQMGLTAWPG